MVVFPNGRSGERLAKRARQSEPHRHADIGAERANSRCSKSFTPDAKMIKGFLRPRTCTSYLHIAEICGIREKDDVIRSFSKVLLVSLEVYCAYVHIVCIYIHLKRLIIFYLILYILNTT